MSEEIKDLLLDLMFTLVYSEKEHKIFFDLSGSKRIRPISAGPHSFQDEILSFNPKQER